MQPPTHQSAVAIWDVVRVPFPYAERPVRQRRPALVIAMPDIPAQAGMLWALMITSADNRGWPGDVVVSDLQAAGLPAPSLVRTEKVATINIADVERLGRLAKADRRAVKARLRQQLSEIR